MVSNVLEMYTSAEVVDYYLLQTLKCLFGNILQWCIRATCLLWLLVIHTFY